MLRKMLYGLIIVLLASKLVFTRLPVGPSHVKAQQPHGPRTDDLIIYFKSTASGAYAMLKNGEADLVAFTGWSVGLPLHDGTQFSKLIYSDAIYDPSIQLAPFLGNDIVGFDFNNNDTIATYPGIRSPMTYLSFRQALAHLVDKNTIVETYKGGFAERIDVPIPATQSDWWNPAVVGPAYPYPYNPLVAAAKLDADGFTEGTTVNPQYDPAFPGSAEYIRVYPTSHPKAGEDLDPIVFYVRTDDMARLEAGRHLYRNMKKLGIPVNAIEWPKEALFDKVMGDRDYHIYTSGYVVKKYPIYLYKLYHSDFWHAYGANYVTGMNGSNLPNYPELDDKLEQLWYNQTRLGSMAACGKAQRIMVDNCVSVWLYSSKGFCAYRNLYGVVNMNGYGLVNKYTFMNARRADDPGAPIRVALVNAPMSLNVLYSSWIYEWICLDRVYTHLLNEAPYNITVDQPWAAQDWHVATWNDTENISSGETKTKITYWLRQDIFWVKPVTGLVDYQLTAHDVEFSIWFAHAFRDCWPWDVVMDIHHTRIIDDFCIEVYMDSLSYWAYYWIGKQLPLIPKQLWLENFCEMKQASIILDRDYEPCEKLMFTEHHVVQVINATLDGTPLIEGADHQIVSWGGIHLADRCHSWIHWLTPASTGQHLTIWYWTPHNAPGPHGFIPGYYLWTEKLEGCGMYYVVDFAPGVGGYIYLRANRNFFMETPILGEIDWVWKWGRRDETRPAPDQPDGPRLGCFMIDDYDSDIVYAAQGSSGSGIPDPNWFPGADLALPECIIDLYDFGTVRGHFGERFGHPPPYKESNIAVTDVSTSKTVVGQGFVVYVNVTVENQGDFTENFNVTAYANTTIVGTLVGITLTSGNSITITFTWDTDGFTKGNYHINAYAEPVPSEITASDNTKYDGYVFVTIAGDVDGDRDVDIYDIVRMCGVYGAIQPDPRYDPECDIDGDGDIDIYDIVAACANYGESW
jgi:ABC-type transport system substrate-binding protein